MSRASYMPGSGFSGRSHYLSRRGDVQTDTNSAAGSIANGAFAEVVFGQQPFSPDLRANGPLVQLQNSTVAIELDDVRMRLRNSSGAGRTYDVRWRHMAPLA